MLKSIEGLDGLINLESLELGFNLIEVKLIELYSLQLTLTGNFSIRIIKQISRFVVR